MFGAVQMTPKPIARGDGDQRQRADARALGVNRQQRRAERESAQREATQVEELGFAGRQRRDPRPGEQEADQPERQVDVEDRPP